MPRMAREKSETGIYHVMLRGIDKRDLFLNDSDYRQFIHYIGKAKEKVEFKVYAYCLMTNHVHLLLKTQALTHNIGDILRRITIGYAQYHNIKNGRTGHLFQNRFKSEAVDSDAYFLTVLRYIHQNPIKAGIVNNMSDYKWSSYKEYFNNQAVLIEPNFALSFFKDYKEFEKFIKESSEDNCLEYEPSIRYTDEELVRFISSFAVINSLDKLDIQTRDKVLKNIKDVTQASNRQLSKVLNVGRGVLDRIK